MADLPPFPVVHPNLPWQTRLKRNLYTRRNLVICRLIYLSFSPRKRNLIDRDGYYRWRWSSKEGCSAVEALSASGLPRQAIGQMRQKEMCKKSRVVGGDYARRVTLGPLISLASVAQRLLRTCIHAPTSRDCTRLAHRGWAHTDAAWDGRCTSNVGLRVTR